jgi:hypothetical protein
MSNLFFPTRAVSPQPPPPSQYTVASVLNPRTNGPGNDTSDVFGQVFSNQKWLDLVLSMIGAAEHLPPMKKGLGLPLLLSLCFLVSL